MVSCQSTGEVSCRFRPAQRSAARVTGRPDTLATSGAAGSSKAVCSRWAAKDAAASASSGEWKAPLTFRGVTRRAPAAFSASPAAATPSMVPEMTTWASELWLARTTEPCSALTAAQTSRTASAPRPMMAAMVPGRFRPASNISSPRVRTRRSACSAVSAPTAAAAENSPRLWPATAEGRMPCSASARATATLWARMAGWALRVSVSFSRGPSYIRPVRSAPRVSFTDARMSAAGPPASARSRAMPTAWDAWPGKIMGRRWVVTGLSLPRAGRRRGRAR